MPTGRIRLTGLAVLWPLLLALAGCRGKQADAPNPAASQGTVAVDPATVGSISGKINLEGDRPRLAEIHMDQDPVCVAKHQGPVLAEDGAVNLDGWLPNTFVYVKGGAEKYAFPALPEPVVLDQNGCLYRPHVFGIMTGQRLRIVSSDPTTHNIHAVARENRQWNESQLPGAAPIEKVFTRPEIMIPIKCNEHPWMKAYAGVVSNPFFAVTGEDGSYTLRGLPPGDYTVEAWTAAFGVAERKATVTSHSSTKLDFTFKP